MSKVNAVRIILIFFGIVFIIAGILRNEVSTIFVKAINICLECIGIG